MDIRRRRALVTMMGGGGTAPAQPTGLTVTPGAAQMALAWTDNATNETAYRVYRSTNGVDYTQVGSDLAADVESYNDTTYTQGTIYYYKVSAVNATGETLSDASDPAYYFADNFDRADGAIGNGWTADTFVVASNVAKNTPTVEADLLTNGTMEAFTDGLADGWTKFATPTVSQETTIVHGGSSSQKIVSDTNGEGITQIGISISPSEWYEADVFCYPESANANLTFSLEDGSTEFISIFREMTAGAWGQFHGTGRAAGNGALRQMRVTNLNGTPTYNVDDWTLKHIVKDTLFATRDTGMSDVDISINLANAYYLSFRNMGGIVACVDDPDAPTCYLHAYYAGARVWLDKVVNGNLTNLLSVSVSHSTNAVLRLVKDGTSVGVFYAGTQRGATQTVSDIDLISNTIHGIAGAHASTTVDNVVMANPTGGLTPPVTPPNSIFAIGDSITDAAADTAETYPNCGWPVHLAQALQTATGQAWFEAPFRYAVAGKDVAYIAANIAGALASRSDTPTYILILLGTNDITAEHGWPLAEAEWKANYRAILDALHGKWSGAEIYLCTSYRYGSEAGIATLKSWMADLVAEHPTYLFAGADIGDVLDGHPELLADGLHPNHDGHVAIANLMAAVITA